MLDRTNNQNLFDPGRPDIASEDEPQLELPLPHQPRAPRHPRPSGSGAQQDPSTGGLWGSLVANRLRDMRPRRLVRYAPAFICLLVLVSRPIGCGHSARSAGKAPALQHVGAAASAGATAPVNTTGSRPAVATKRVEHAAKCPPTARHAVISHKPLTAVPRSIARRGVSPSLGASTVVVPPSPDVSSVGVLPPAYKAPPEMGIEFSFEN